MKSFLLFAALFVCFGLSSCQCSDKPEIGPVDQGTTLTTGPSARVA